jgi:hypothetical protein
MIFNVFKNKVNVILRAAALRMTRPYGRIGIKKPGFLRA